VFAIVALVVAGDEWMPLRIVVMGTGSFAVPTFQTLLDSDHQVAAIVTQPDRVGRGHHRHPHPVRELGERHGITVLQPQRAAAADFIDQLQAIRPDVIIVAAYGQILKKSLLEIPGLGAFNLHGSLLPRHRGAAPVQYSIWKGDQRTGVTMFQIEPALDSGPIVGTCETEIQPSETSASLMARLAELSAPLTLDVLQQLEAGTAVFTPQNHAAATLAPKIAKEDGEIDWQQSATAVDCHIRAMIPWPRASTCLLRPGHADLRCILHEVIPHEDGSPVSSITRPPGTVSLQRREMFVSCGSGNVQIRRIQPQGGRVLSIGDFVNGQADLQQAAFK
jgi:methionyl-tRNA formyltransferase